VAIHTDFGSMDGMLTLIVSESGDWLVRRFFSALMPSIAIVPGSRSKWIFGGSLLQKSERKLTFSS